LKEFLVQLDLKLLILVIIFVIELFRAVDRTIVEFYQPECFQVVPSDFEVLFLEQLLYFGVFLFKAFQSGKEHFVAYTLFYYKLSFLVGLQTEFISAEASSGLY